MKHQHNGGWVIFGSPSNDFRNGYKRKLAIWHEDRYGLANYLPLVTMKSYLRTAAIVNRLFTTCFSSSTWPPSWSPSGIFKIQIFIFSQVVVSHYIIGHQSLVMEGFPSTSLKWRRDFEYRVRWYFVIYFVLIDFSRFPLPFWMGGSLEKVASNV